MGRSCAFILSIGTELTSGIVINSNATKLSEWLCGLGFEVAGHLTVPDDDASIKEGLEYCVSRSEVVFTTGGLGPTSDDFTARVISEWVGQDLVFHEPSWQKIQKKFDSQGMPTPESNRSQCFFPKSAIVLDNPAGTANAFRVDSPAAQVVCLPGPPREIEAIWNDGLSEYVQSNFSLPRLKQRFSWTVQGVSESMLADLIDPALSEYSNFEIGFRPRFPVIDIRILAESGDDTFAVIKKKIDQLIAEWVLPISEKTAESRWESIFSALNCVYVDDQLTQGCLLEALMPLILKSDMALIARQASAQCQPAESVFVKVGSSANQWTATIESPGYKIKLSEPLPKRYKNSPRLSAFLAHRIKVLSMVGYNE